VPLYESGEKLIDVVLFGLKSRPNPMVSVAGLKNLDTRFEVSLPLPTVN
jgi:hypothetical protein